jgi:spore coat protein CotH
MKVKINWDDSKTEFFGQRKLQFNSQNRDPSMMHERLGYWLFGEMGIAAPRSTHARVNLNGEYLGIFALTELVDGRFTRANFDEGKGNLYKGIWPFWSDFNVSPEAELLAGLRTNEDDNPSVEIITTFAQELAAASPADRPAVLGRWADVEALMTYSVVDRAIRHDDGPMHWYCNEQGCGNQNFYWYESPDARTVHLIPWDLDGAFRNLTDQSDYTYIADAWGDITNDCQTFTDGPLERLQRSAACDPLIGTLVTFEDDYARIREQFLTGPFAQERVEAKLAEWTSQIEDAVAEAAAAHSDAVPVQQWNLALEELRAGLEISRNT